MTPFLSLLVDLSVAGLLLAVIIYCKKLSRSIATLQNSRGEMAKLFAQFDTSIEAAQASVRELREATQKSEEILREKLDTANSLADDLAFMIERGNKTADQIENSLKGGRNALHKDAPPAAPQPDDEPFGKPPISGHKNLRGKAASLEAVLEQMANRNNPAGKSADGKAHSRIRSKAEQELFDSLKSSR
jgi:vacuolar-type H+-ATPase subunit H